MTEKTKFTDCWPALARLTPQERERAIAHRAGLRGAFGDKRPNPPGTRRVSKLSRKATPFATTVQDRRAVR